MRDLQTNKALAAHTSREPGADGAGDAVVAEDLLDDAGAAPGGTDGVGPLDLIGHVGDGDGAGVGEIKPRVVEGERERTVVGNGGVEASGVLEEVDRPVAVGVGGVAAEGWLVQFRRGEPKRPPVPEGNAPRR